VGKRSQELAKAGKLGPLQPPKEHGPAPRTLPKLDDSKITETRDGTRRGIFHAGA